MAFSITQKNLKEFITKASRYTTGGGLDVARQLASLKPIENEMNVKFILPSQFHTDAFACSVTEIGNPQAPPIDKKIILHKMIHSLERIHEKKITAFFPPEVGQESIVLESAHYAGLPVVDFDPVGFRAVPFVDISIFRLHNLNASFGPAVIATDQGEILTIESHVSYDRAESIIRSVTQSTVHGCVFVLGEAVSGRDIHRFSRGQVMSYHSMMKGDGVPVDFAMGTFHVIQKKEFTYTGFFCEILTIQSDETKKLYILCFLNEALVLYDIHKALIASAPMRILVTNETDTMGVASVDLAVGSVITLTILKPEPLWESKEAHKLFGINRLSFFQKHL